MDKLKKIRRYVLIAKINLALAWCAVISTTVSQYLSHHDGNKVAISLLNITSVGILIIVFILYIAVNQGIKK